MSKDKIADYDGATAGNNTDIGGISIAEGMLPSAVNNSMRELTRQLGAFADGTEGIDVLNLHDDDASASIKIQAPATVTTTTTFTLPDGDGTSGYALVTNGSGQLSWASAGGIANVADDTTPQLGGDLDTNGNDINFGDNDKAVFGAGSDLQVYHDGSASYIIDSGTGNLLIRANDLRLQDDVGGHFIQGNKGSDVKIYHPADGIVHLATTSSGIDVTGTVTADKLTVDGDTNGDPRLAHLSNINTGTLAEATVYITNSTSINDGLFLQQMGSGATTLGGFVQDGSTIGSGTGASGGLSIMTRAAADMRFYTNGHTNERLRISSGGDISFYDSTGVTQGFYWDASTQRLGLGSTAPEVNLHIEDTSSFALARLVSSTTSVSGIDFGDTDDKDAGRIRYSNADDSMRFTVNGSEKAVITSAGSVGIGTASPNRPLQISSSENTLASFTSTDGGAYVEFVDPSASAGQVYIGTNASGFQITTGGSEAARIDSSQNFLVATSSYDGSHYNDTSGGGFAVTSAGKIDMKCDGTVANFNRTSTSDGDILYFAKQGTTVGSIASRSGIALTVNSQSGNGNLAYGGTNYVEWNNTRLGVATDNTIDLGRAAGRWKDAYFSGTVNAGGLSVERSSNNTGGITVQNTNNAQASAVAQVEISGGDNAYANLLLECSGTNHSIRQDGSGNLKFINASSERARFTSTGAFILGKTVDSIHNTGISAAGSATGGGHLTATNSGNPPFALNRLASDGSIADFYRQGSVVGSISVATSGTTYNTTSDIRLKQDIEPIADGTDKLMAMNPVSYNWKADPDGPRSMGFIAQEMKEVMPEAVAVGDDEDAMMSMDYGRITPVLVAALQDAHRKIEQLEQRLADMEAK